MEDKKLSEKSNMKRKVRGLQVSVGQTALFPGDVHKMAALEKQLRELKKEKDPEKLRKGLADITEQLNQEKPKRRADVALIDRRFYDQTHPLFISKISPQSFDRTEQTPEGEQQVFKISKGENTVEYKIIKGKLAALKENRGSLSLYLLGRAAWIASLNIAFEQQTDTPTFTKGDILKKLGYTNLDRGGKIFDDIEGVFAALLNTTYTMWNNKTGKESYIKIGHLWDEITKIGEGREATYTVRLPRASIESVIGLVLGTANSPTGQYVSHPMKFLQEGRSLKSSVQNGISRLIGLQGIRFAIKITGKKMLADWCGVDNHTLKSPKESHQIIYDFLDKAKELGYLQAYKIVNYGKKATNCLYWTFALTLPKIEKAPQRAELTNEGKALAKRIALWATENAYQPSHKGKAEVERIALHLIRKKGYEPIEKLLKVADNARIFFSKVKRLPNEA